MITEIALFESTNIKALLMVIKKGKLLTVNFVLILIEYLNAKSVSKK